MRVLVTGIFDLLHVEHVRFLASAKNPNHKSPAFACQSPASRTIRSRLMARYSAGREIINEKPSFRAKRSGVEESSEAIEISVSPAAGSLDSPDSVGVARDDGRTSRDDESYLIVGIESDNRVRRLKGEGRPVMRQEDRKEMLEGLKMVDEVMILPDKFDSDDDYLKLLREVKPDIYAVSENSPYMENKRRICERAGVTLKVVHEYNPEYSTSSLIKKITISSGLPRPPKAASQ